MEETVPPVFVVENEENSIDSVFVFGMTFQVAINPKSSSFIEPVMKLTGNSPRKFFIPATVLASLVFSGCASDPVSKNVALASAVRGAAPNCELHSVVLQRVSGENVSANLLVSRPGKRAEEVSVELVAGTLTPASQSKLRPYSEPAKNRVVPAPTSEDEGLDKQLFRAVRSGNTSSAQKLISAGANPNAPESGRETHLNPLAIAVLRNDYFMVRMLLQNGADPNVRLRFESIQFSGTFDEGTVIHLAACNGSEAMVRLLARYGADLDAICESDEKFSVRINALGLALKIKRYNVVRTLLANGANADVPCQISPRNDVSGDRNLPVFMSAFDNFMLNIFVDAGADLNVGENFAPPIIFAVDAGNAALVEKMLRLGANPNFEHADAHLRLRNGKKISADCTPIFHVKNPAIAELLVRSGADLNHEISEGIFSPNYRVLDVVGDPVTRKYLISAGAKEAAKD